MSRATIINPNIYIQQLDDNNPCPNSNDFNFEVLTKINFESKQNLTIYLENINQEESSRENDKTIELLKKRAEKELLMNTSLIENKNGMDLRYGDIIILKHLNSGY